MKRYHLMSLTLCIILTNPTLLQAANAYTSNDPQTYWQCRVFDNQGKQWSAKSTYEKSAINKAYHACKKQSRVPSSCKAAKEYCDAFVHGRNTRPMWQCTALDRMANAWKSGIYRHQDDAALGARAYCRERSKVPSTCYVNMITCENLNALPISLDF